MFTFLILSLVLVQEIDNQVVILLDINVQEVIILTPCAKLILFGLLLVYEKTLTPWSDVNIIMSEALEKIF